MTVGVGNRWAQVYSQLDALGIAIGGGRVASVGVGGLTLGGKCFHRSAPYLGAVRMND